MFQSVKIIFKSLHDSQFAKADSLALQRVINQSKLKACCLQWHTLRHQQPDVLIQMKCHYDIYIKSCLMCS